MEEPQTPDPGWCKIQEPKDDVTIVVYGASGDLAKKKIYPVLYKLYRDCLLPRGAALVGYARSDMSKEDLKASVKPYIQVDISG